MVAFYLMQSGGEAIPMNSMRRDDVIWTVVVTLIASRSTPSSNRSGCCQRTFLRVSGLPFPASRRSVFGPLMAFPASRLVPENRQSHGLSSDRIPARVVAELRIPDQRGA